MTKSQLLAEAEMLPEKDRLELAIHLWDSVDSGSNALPLTDDQRAELDRRWAMHMADPTNTVSADEVLAEIANES